MTRFTLTAIVAVGGFVMATLVRPSSALGQVHPPDGDYIPVDKPVATEGAPPHLPATAFFMPDVPDDWNQKTTYDGRVFSARFGTCMLVDYSSFTQDADSVRQVGAQVDQWDLRSWRFWEHGSLKFKHPVDYFAVLQIRGPDHVTNGKNTVGFTDWYVGTDVGPLGHLHYGKLKEPFAYEMVGDAANLPPQERILNPFFVSRAVGLQLTNTMARNRMSWSVGWFNSWWEEHLDFGSSANDFAGRLAGLPYLSKDGGTYLHLAASLRYAGDSNGTMRFRDRPESNTADYYVDTGNIQAAHAINTSAEALWTRGPLTLMGEFARSRVDAPAVGDPSFWGAYATVAYVLTGEHRPYDPRVGYARRVLPQGRGGAWEIFARYSHIDLNDALVAGGLMDTGTLGVNWWATRRWKLGFDYGLTDLARFGIQGWTNRFHSRLQWVY